MNMDSSNKIISPKIMGILNITPDSFSDGGKYQNIDNAIKRALEMHQQGADIIDIGGESTRPYADFVELEEESRRILPVIEQLSSYSDLCLSIDTRKPEIAIAAIKAGAHIWNDVSGLTYSKNSLSCAKDLNVPIILMHSKGSPKTMQNNPVYDDVVSEVFNFLKTQYRRALDFGIQQKHIIIDPGIGFGKNKEDNLILLKSLDIFKQIAPLLLGVSRKKIISDIDHQTDQKDVRHRIGGSLAFALWGFESGIDYIRVHDVQETVQAFKIWSNLKQDQ